MKLFKLFILFLLIFIAENSFAQKKKTRILFIFDASNSMNTEWEGSTRIHTAKKVMLTTMDSLAKIENLEIGLRIYGHQSALRPPKPQDCNDTKLEVPIGAGTTEQIKSKIKGIIAKGTTPIAISLEKAAEDFTACSDCNNVIILVTDGIEACDGDPCAVAKALKAKDIKVTPFVIGVGLDLSYIETLSCIGNAYNAHDEKSFLTILGVIVNEAINTTTTQIDLNNLAGKPTQSNVPITLYDQKSGEAKYHFEHTLNKSGVPDTLHIDAIFTYKMVVHSVPEIVKENIKIEVGKHNTIKVDAPMGYLDLKVKNDHTNVTGIKCIVRKDGETKTLYQQPFNLSQKYIDGTYDLEILTLPRIYMDDITIKQDQTFPIEIAHPGTLEMRIGKYAVGSIFLINEKGEYEWLYSLDEIKLTQIVALQPGNYSVLYRYKMYKQTGYSQEIKFTITTKKSTIIKL
jgi:Ca-activated chloride channel family protein